MAKLLGQRDVTKPPPGVDPVFWDSVLVPEDNKMTRERVELGRRLYFDTRLSADGTVACATCHDVSQSFTGLAPARKASAIRSGGATRRRR